MTEDYDEARAFIRAKLAELRALVRKIELETEAHIAEHGAPKAEEGDDAA